MCQAKSGTNDQTGGTAFWQRLLALQAALRKQIGSASLALLIILSSMLLPVTEAATELEPRGEILAALCRDSRHRLSQTAHEPPSELLGAPQVLTQTVTVWLPQVMTRWTNTEAKPIWAVGEISEGMVALFRQDFVLSRGCTQAELSIIGDTRFEVWLDGTWVGRGPARFSRVRQEYDVLALGPLNAGPHALAVLVQYAPNVRRSESSLPALQASLRCWDGSWQTVVVTNSKWKAIVAPAWDARARQVSQLQLIGPMEVLDLRLLPEDWVQTSYDIGWWPYAQEIDPTPFPAQSPRTIPLLRNIPRPPTAVVEAGLLSPGRQIIELEHPTESGSPVSYSLVVTATSDTTLQLEALETSPISVDDSPALTWISLNQPRRPDVLVAEQALTPGQHTLHIDIPPERPCLEQAEFNLSRAGLPGVENTDCTLSSGRTVAISLDSLQLAGNPGVVPTHDPGRRTLLVEPMAGGVTAPIVQILPDGAQIYVPPGSTARYVVLDFGRTLHGRLSLIASGPAGAVVDAGWDERLTEGRPLPNPGSLISHLWSQVDSWVLDGTARHLTTLDARAGRYLILQVFGPGPVHLEQVHVEEEAYPVDQRGWFESSDALLNQIWQVGVDTLVPNMTDAYTDTPWRERGQWWGDAMISFHINRAAFGDLALFRRGLRQMADAISEQGQPTPMAPNGTGILVLDFGMQWIDGLHLYWTLSDDLALVEELYPAATRLTGFLVTYRGESGLLDVPASQWWQSALVDWPAVSSRSGESTALNALYASVLHQMGEMADGLGHSAQAQAYFDQSTRIKAALNEILFLPDQGCYAASRLGGEVVAPSPHAQSWALRYDVVPTAWRRSTALALSRQLTPFFDPTGWSVVEPLGMFAALEAMGRAKLTKEALDLIRERYGDLLTKGATTWWELYTPLQDRGHSLSHAWGGSPTWFLSSHVLGGIVTGSDQWQVAPHPGDLAYAQGTVPLNSQTLNIAWQHPQCGQFDLTVTAPAASTGDILLPLTRYDSQVSLDEILIWDGGPVGTQPVEMTADGLLITGITEGEHEISSLFSCPQSFLPFASR